MTELYNFFANGEIPAQYKAPELIRQSLGMLLCLYLCNGCNLYDLALLRYDDYYDVSEHKALRHSDISKEELVRMLKNKMTKEELLSLLLG